MAHVQEWIEVGRAAAETYDQWTEFEELRPFLDALRRIREANASLDWRAEVLTVAPLDDVSLLSVRIEYDALGAKDDIRRTLGEVSTQLRSELARFKAFAEAGVQAEGRGWGPLPAPSACA